MHFSKVTLRREGLAVGDLARLLRRDGYRAHQHLWALFGDSPERRRDFLYRQEGGRGDPFFYVVSVRAPRAEEGPWHVESKLYAPRIAAGSRLAFTLRVNPVRSRPAEKGRRGQRHDVVMDAKHRMRGPGQPAEHDALVRGEGLAWLEERAERHGFRLDPGALRVHSYRQHRLYKPRGSPIRFSTLDYDGLLTVTDPQRLLETLQQGLGPAKGFGCGLLLVRRV